MSSPRLWSVTIAVLMAVGGRAHGESGRDNGNLHIAAAAAQPAPVAVEVTVVGTSGDLQRIRTLFGTGELAGVAPTWVLISRFDPLDILREHRPPQPRAVRCWVDMSRPERIQLFFAAGSGERFLVRDVAISPRFDEVNQQALEEVLQRSATALLEDEQVGLDRARAQALLQSRRERESPKPGFSLTAEPATPHPAICVKVGAFYAGQALRLAHSGGNTVALMHGPGLWLASGTAWGQRWWGIWGAAQLQFPNRELTNDVGLELQTIATRAGLEVQQTLGYDAVDQRLVVSYLLLRVGAGLDLVRLTPHPGAANRPVMLTQARWSNSGVFTAAVGGGLRVSRQVQLTVVAFADILPTTVIYDFAAQGQVAPMFSAARVRPGVAVELATSLF